MRRFVFYLNEEMVCYVNVTSKQVEKFERFIRLVLSYAKEHGLNIKFEIE